MILEGSLGTFIVIKIANSLQNLFLTVAKFLIHFLVSMWWINWLERQDKRICARILWIGAGEEMINIVVGISLEVVRDFGSESSVTVYKCLCALRTERSSLF